MNSFDNISCEEFYSSENDWTDYDNYLASVMDEEEETKCTRCGCVDNNLEYVTNGRSLCFDCYEDCGE